MQRPVQSVQSEGLESLASLSVHVCAAVQSAKGLGEVEYRWEGVVINKYTLNHRWQLNQSQRSMTTAQQIEWRLDVNSNAVAL